MSARVNVPKPEILTPKADSRMLERLLPRPIELDDGGIRLLCIPLFGIAIPFVTGLYGPIGPASLAFWPGFAWFIGVSSAIWHGNRYFYLRQRQSNDWFQHPARRIFYMLVAIVFYTVPCSVSMLLVWYGANGFAPDWPAIRMATLISGPRAGLARR
ncbi:MAG: hypothetical protein HYX27_18110 [Acidobacteria bacterium]|nr:hypothetical protein [Acidobacteriota bacterium]